MAIRLFRRVVTKICPFATNTLPLPSTATLSPPRSANGLTSLSDPSFATTPLYVRSSSSLLTWTPADREPLRSNHTLHQWEKFHPPPPSPCAKTRAAGKNTLPSGDRNSFAFGVDTSRTNISDSVVSCKSTSEVEFNYKFTVSNNSPAARLTRPVVPCRLNNLNSVLL